MKLGLAGMSREQSAIGSLSLVILSRGRIQLRELALRLLITRRQSDSRLQFRDRCPTLALSSQHASQLNMCRTRVHLLGKQFAQIILGLGKTVSAHVEIDQPD